MNVRERTTDRYAQIALYHANVVGTMGREMRGKIPKGMSVDDWAKALPKGQGAIVQELRKTIRKAAPEVREVVKWSWPWYEINEPFAAIMVAGDHVNLELYRGTKLESDKVKLEGTGKSMRHVKIFTVAELRGLPIADLIKEAVEFDAARGKGPWRV